MNRRLTGCLYAVQLRRLLMPTMGPKSTEGPCLLDLLAGIPALQQPLLVLILETLILCCQHVSTPTQPPPPASAHHVVHMI